MRQLQYRRLFVLAISCFVLGDASNLRKRSGSFELDASSEHSGKNSSVEIDASSGRGQNEHVSSTTAENFIDSSVDGALGLTGKAMNGTQNMAMGAFNKTLNFIEKIPLVGGITVKVMVEMRKGFRGFEKFTNGFMGRMMGGSLPCTVTLKNGTVCEGVKKNGGMSRVILNAMAEIPLMPRFVIQVMNATMATVFNPMTDMMTGGVVEYNN